MPITDRPAYLSLFHGTSEPFTTPLRPGAYDGVLWTAVSADIARIYIPLSGVSVLYNLPCGHELDQHAPPHKNSVATLLARQMGYPDPDCEYDARGNLGSWSAKACPTNREILNFIETLGYATTGQDTIWLSEDLKTQTIRPASARLAGRLFETAIDATTLNLYDLRSIEFDFSDPFYHRLALFDRLREKSFDGLIVNDMAKDHDGEFIGHVSYGFFEKAVSKMRFSVTPSTHQTIAEWQNSTLKIAS